MARPVTARMGEALKAGAPICLLAQFDHPEGVLRYWTGIGPLEYDGETWMGLGTIGKVTPIKYSAELAIQELVFEMSGVPVEDQRWLSADIRNRQVDVWLAALNPDGSVVATPKRIVRARLDYPKYSQAEDGTTTIQLIARSGFYTLERALDEVHSAEDQRRLYPGDSGMDMISQLQQLEVIWRPA